MERVDKNSFVRNVTGVDPKDIDEMKTYLNGMVDCWCKNQKDEWFTASSLLGGANFDWFNTPMYKLFEKHKDKEKGDHEAVKGAGIDAGWLLKAVLRDNRRRFETRKGFRREYGWIQD